VPPANLPAYYNLADLFVLPSMEGFGIAAIEASACGVPVVGLRAGGLLDAVQDGVTGVLVGPGELASLSNVLIDLLQNRERARRLGCAGRRWAEEKFPWGRVQETFRVAAESGVGARRKP
jgi:glycosyltransferase involved in cell wall biosynthesis